MSPAQMVIPGRGIGGWVAHHLDWRNWTINAGIWGGGEIMARDASETTAGQATYYTAAAADLDIIGISAMGNEPDRKYGTTPQVTPVGDEDLVGIIDMARGVVRVANDNSAAIIQGMLLSAEKDTQTIENVAGVATLTAVDIAVISVLADATDVTGVVLRLLIREVNKTFARANENKAQVSTDAQGIDVTLLLGRPEIVVPSA